MSTDRHVSCTLYGSHPGQLSMQPQEVYPTSLSQSFLYVSQHFFYFESPPLNRILSCIQKCPNCTCCRSRWQCGLRGDLLGSRVRILRMAWTFVQFVCCVLCSYRLLRRADHSFKGVFPGVCLVVCASRNPTKKRPRPDFGCYTKIKWYLYKKKLTQPKVRVNTAGDP